MMSLDLLMHREVETMPFDSTLRQVAQRMGEKKIGSLLVVKDGKTVGIVSETDLARKAVARGLDPERAKAGDIMSSPVISIDANGSAEDANDLMKLHGVRHLVVMDGEKVVGIISVRDLLRYFKVYYDGLGSLRKG